MKTFLDCFPCIMTQALRAGRIATDDENKIKEILGEVGCALKTLPLENTPPHNGEVIYRIISEVTGNPDPYREIKKSNIKEALSHINEFRKIINGADDPLLMAIRLAIAGNVIDFGVNGSFDIIAEVNETIDKEFAICDYSSFLQELYKTEYVLYLGDNAGESVFDRLLIEQLGKPVLYAVRGIPVINDVTEREAVESGINEVATIISSGSTAPGAIPELCSPKFRNLLNNSEFIISKGQGNYEALSGANLPVFFMLKAKCEIIASDIGVKKNDIIVKRNRIISNNK